jgi:hypothetical protein
LQTIRGGIIAGLTEWKNRKNSGIVDAEAQALADATILHFTSQIGAVDKAIALAIQNDSDLRSNRDLLLSISGVGDTLAGVVWPNCLVRMYCTRAARWSPMRD